MCGRSRYRLYADLLPGNIIYTAHTGVECFHYCTGNTFVSMYNVAIGAISNILLDAVFINVFHMGVRGAALATVISQGISAGLVTYYLCRGKSIPVKK